MSENKRRHRQHGEPDPSGDDHRQGPYWTRAHRDWKFWGALFLMFAAMMIYVMGDNLVLRPRPQPQQARSGTVGK